jgi:hypothetical protein
VNNDKRHHGSWALLYWTGLDNHHSVGLQVDKDSRNNTITLQRLSSISYSGLWRLSRDVVK